MAEDRDKKTLAGMADDLMTQEQKDRANKIRARNDRTGHDKKNGLR